MQFADGEIYHIYNRSVAGTEIFIKKRTNNRFLDLVNYYRYQAQIRYSRFMTLPQTERQQFWDQITKRDPHVILYAFTLMPNHYHFVVKQLGKNGIRIFLTNLQNSFARYYNTKNQRAGSLFQNRFKAKRVETNEQFIHLIRYVHINPLTSYSIKQSDLAEYLWNSYGWYLDEGRNIFIDTSLIKSHFRTTKRFSEFTMNNVDYQRKLAKIKHLILEK